MFTRWRRKRIAREQEHERLLHRVRVAEKQLRQYDIRLAALSAPERTVVNEYIADNNRRRFRHRV